DLRGFITRAKTAGVLVAVGTDLLACVLLTPPGEVGADVVYGNSQRFGVPLGYGGPHAAFFATLEKHVRHAPRRIIRVSVAAPGRSTSSISTRRGAECRAALRRSTRFCKPRSPRNSIWAIAATEPFRSRSTKRRRPKTSATSCRCSRMV